jgi:hypothetical protein
MTVMVDVILENAGIAASPRLLAMTIYFEITDSSLSL